MLTEMIDPPGVRLLPSGLEDLASPCYYHGLKAKLDSMVIIRPRFDLMTSHPHLVGWEGVGRVGWVAIN